MRHGWGIFTKWRIATRSYFSLPVSEELCRRILSLSMHAYTEQAPAEQICGAVKTVAVSP
jgi:dTDP-4-amino-4,6-dideoxygalactose transaminase